MTSLSLLLAPAELLRPELLAQMIRVDVHRQLLISANHRGHWAKGSTRARRLRELTTWEAIRFRQRLHLTGPLTARVHCEVLVTWPDGRRRDVHNLMPTVKPCIDGIVDGKVLVDDSDRYLIGPDLRVTDGRCDPALACSLIFVLRALPAVGHLDPSTRLWTVSYRCGCFDTQRARVDLPTSCGHHHDLAVDDAPRGEHLTVGHACPLPNLEQPGGAA